MNFLKMIILMSGLIAFAYTNAANLSKYIDNLSKPLILNAHDYPYLTSLDHNNILFFLGHLRLLTHSIKSTKLDAEKKQLKMDELKKIIAELTQLQNDEKIELSQSDKDFLNTEIKAALSKIREVIYVPPCI